ncbi:MAG: ABC transporter substrate-binding protein [Planctomycetes bacterium]|nr:ABC transporter substrate-binding protein [Planctomycetota bacterium]
MPRSPTPGWLPACSLFLLMACSSGSASVPAPTAAIDDPYPRRIVSLNCNATDVLVAIGAIDRVIAVEEDCPTCGAEGKILVRNDDHFGKSKPLCIEAVLALQPDAVFTRPSLRDLFESCGVRVLTSPLRADLTTLPDYVRAIGGMVGTPDRAEAVLEAMAAKQERIRSRCQGLPKVRVYYETTGLGQSAGSRSIMHAMIELAGGANIAAEVERSATRLTNEAIVAADPEVIVLSPFADPVEAVVERPAWRGLSAVRNGRIHRLPLEHRYVAMATPRCVDGCETFLVPWFHPALAARAEGR